MIRGSRYFRFALAPVLLWWFCGSVLCSTLDAGQGWPEDVRRGLDRLEAPNGDAYQALAILADLDLDNDVRTRLHLRLLEHPHRAVKLFALRAMESFPPDRALAAVAEVVAGSETDDELTEAAARTFMAIGIRTNDEASRVAKLLDLPRLGSTSRAALMDLLGQSGALAIAEVPRLESGLSSEAVIVRFSAFRALGRIENRADRSTSGIDLDKADYSVFASIQSDDVKSAASWIEPLLALAQNTDQTLVRRGAAVETLGVIAAHDPRVVSCLLDLRLEPDSLLADLALDGLGEVPPGSAGMRLWADRLPALDLRTKLDALTRLREAGADAAFANEPLVRIWSQADGETPDVLLAAVLDVFRAMGPAAVSADLRLSEFLPHEFAAYQQRDRLETIRLRAYLMVTLAEVGLPAEAYPYLLDSLAHIDERVVAIEVGAAVRAVGSIKSDARFFIPFLLEAITRLFAEEEFSLARYEVDFPREEATTVQLEVLDVLSALCVPGDEKAIRLLQRFAQTPTSSRWDPRAVAGARRALASIHKTKDSS